MCVCVVCMERRLFYMLKKGKELCSEHAHTPTEYIAVPSSYNTSFLSMSRFRRLLDTHKIILWHTYIDIEVSGAREGMDAYNNFSRVICGFVVLRYFLLTRAQPRSALH